MKVKLSRQVQEMNHVVELICRPPKRVMSCVVVEIGRSVQAYMSHGRGLSVP